MEYLRGPTLTHLIAKEHPLPAARVLAIVDQIDILTRQLKQTARPPSEVVTVPPAIEQLVMTAISKRPGDRFADAPAMRTAITALTTPARSARAFVCASCGAQAAIEFRFCPECGQPRRALTSTAELPLGGAAWSRCARARPGPWPWSGGMSSSTAWWSS